MTSAFRFVAALAVLAAAAPAFAQDERQTPAGRNQFQPEPPSADAPATQPGKRTTKELLAEGYEIKAFSIVPRAIVVGGGSTEDVDAVMMIMQNGDSLANCYFTFGSLTEGSYYSGTPGVCTVLE